MVEAPQQGSMGDRFRIGDVLVEPGLNSLTSAQGVVPLEPRVMELLVCLARHAGETVSKELLLVEVWGGSFVVDGVVAKTVSALRQALGDDAGQPRYILTVPRRGYRLIAETLWEQSAIEPAAAPPPSPAALLPSTRRPWALAAGLALLAVLVVSGVWALRRDLSSPPLSGAEAQLPVELERQLLKARMLWSRRGFDELLEAHELFSQVAAAAPDSGEAHAWLALSLVTHSTYSQGGRRATLLEAEVEVGRALALAPEHPVTLTAMGVVAFNQHFDLDRAIAAYRRAIERAPDFAPPHQFLAEALTAKGQLDEGLEEIRRAVELEPTSALMHGVHALVAMAANRPEEALAATDRALALETRFWWLYRYRGQAWLRLGDPAQAAEALVSEWAGPESTPQRAVLAEIAEGSGLAGLWRQRVDTLLERRRRAEPVLHIQLAEAYAALGQHEEALTELESGAVADEAEYFVHARPSPAFDALRDHPRFRASYARYGL